MLSKTLAMALTGAIAVPSFAANLLSGGTGPVWQVCLRTTSSGGRVTETPMPGIATFDLKVTQAPGPRTPPGAQGGAGSVTFVAMGDDHGWREQARLCRQDNGQVDLIIKIRPGNLPSGGFPNVVDNTFTSGSNSGYTIIQMFDASDDVYNGAGTGASVDGDGRGVPKVTTWTFSSIQVVPNNPSGPTAS